MYFIGLKLIIMLSVVVAALSVQFIKKLENDWNDFEMTLKNFMNYSSLTFGFQCCRELQKDSSENLPQKVVSLFCPYMCRALTYLLLLRGKFMEHWSLETLRKQVKQIGN